MTTIRDKSEKQPEALHGKSSEGIGLDDVVWELENLSFDATRRADERVILVEEKAKLLKPIHEVSLTRFKQHSDLRLNLKSNLSLMAGSNNSGKSSILQALAVWEFCRLSTTMERGGRSGLYPNRVGVQGFGISEDEFSPINIPSLKHMWTNLKPGQKNPGEDGYTLKIGIEWTTGIGQKHLTFGLSLANDRLFIRVDKSNLGAGDAIPRIAYLPPFAGITAHEQRVSGALRRRRIGEGLAGAVLRNLLLEMQQENVRKRTALRNSVNNGKRSKIRDKDLEDLRQSDPWELLQQTLREVFGAELSVSEFREEYHSYIQVQVIKGTLSGHKLTPHRNFTKRDLMVEGSGFLQWLSVFALATSPEVDVLLLDEPDAHLHPQLQKELLDRLENLTESSKKQVFVATHSSEILKHSEPGQILEFRENGPPRYLTADHQKIGLLEGIGAHYAPRIDKIRRTRKVFFHEGTTDIEVLRKVGEILNKPLSNDWVAWKTERSHKDRKMLWMSLEKEISGLIAVSLRDRDEEEVNTVDHELRDKSIKMTEGFDMRKWRRRHLESYLIVPRALSAAAKMPVDDVVQYLSNQHALVIPSDYYQSNCPGTLLEIRGKTILEGLQLTAGEVVQHLEPHEVCEDLRIMVDLLSASTE
ncbi:AAA family ATPase [Glutamicibacter creatinolyticus]|nr:AAA family ATPase [Glutamicibacter creatinolyticus]